MPGEAPELLAVYLLLALALLLLNAFFVLAEFAAVKLRPTRVEELAASGTRSALGVKAVKQDLDEYLSVCQVGITFASIGLGFVGEPAVARLIEPLFRGLGEGGAAAQHGVAVVLAYVLVSFLHILVGELVPKSIAIRATEPSALWTAVPLQFFRALFRLPLFVLNGSATLILVLLGLPAKPIDEAHSEAELRMILGRSQRRGLMSFRRLLFVENILDMDDLSVRDVMRVRSEARTLQLGAAWEENLEVIREAKFSRYPLMRQGYDMPLGILHVKDLVLSESPGPAPDLEKLARRFLTISEDANIESLLTSFQRQPPQFALVVDRDGRWTGFVTFEDVIEEIIGAVEDEFVTERPVSVAEALAPERVVLELQADTFEGAVRDLLGRIPAGGIPVAPEKLVKSQPMRDATLSAELGRGLGIAHVRVEGLDKPVMLVGRSQAGIPIKESRDRAHLVFVLLKPAAPAQLPGRLLGRLGEILESDFVVDRLRKAQTAAEVVEAVRAGEAACTT